MRALQDSEAVEEAAARWVSIRESDRWSLAEEARFDAWCSESLAHRVAWLRLHAAWQRAEVLQSLREPLPTAGESVETSFATAMDQLIPD